MNRSKDRQTIELLAPAGSMDSLKAAVAAGADAGYMGGSRFGARAYAESTGEDCIREAIEYVHLHGRKLYLTVNTLLKEEELTQQLYDYLLPYYEMGLDAVIVQDLGVLSFVRRAFPDLHVHASTQMTVTGALGAGLLKELGVCRVVAARELSLRELKEISEETGLELEAFVHGSICYCYSGQCLYSSMIGGRSGNRGRCAQPCRLPYEVTDRGRKMTGSGENYVLNLKDMCTLQDIPDLLDAGVTSLKIEGRMKSATYTAGVVSIYRRYVDLYLEHGRDRFCVNPQDIKNLAELFDRGGFTDRYLHSHNHADMIALGEKPDLRQPDRNLTEYIENTYLKPQLKEHIQGKVRFEPGFPAIMELKWRDTSVRFEGRTVEAAMKQPLTEENVRRQFSKTGGTEYEFDRLETELHGDCFMPVQAQNELRREGLEALRHEVLKQHYRNAAAKPRITEEDGAAGREAGMAVSVSLEDSSCLDLLLRQKFVDRVLLDGAWIGAKDAVKCAERCHGAGKQCLYMLPPILRSTSMDLFKKEFSLLKAGGIDGFLVRNLEEVQFLREHGNTLPIQADHTLYTWNRESRRVLELLGISSDTAPLELNSRELTKRGMEHSELLIYGRLPMMTTAGCIRNTLKGCTGTPGLLWMKDRKKMSFPVKNNCRYCFNTIYNSLPLSLFQMFDEVLRLKPAGVRLSFTIEAEDEIRQVLKLFNSILLKESGGELPEFTRGHFKRGVE